MILREHLLEHGKKVNPDYRKLRREYMGENRAKTHKPLRF